MTFLALNGTTVRTRSDAVQQKDNEHRIDRERMFDGTMRMTRGGVFRQWDVTTAFLSESDANTLLALVRSGNVLTASGDLVGADVAVMPVPGNDNPKQTGDGFRRQVTFTLHETGGPLPADTSAPLGAFFRGGVGYRTGSWEFIGTQDGLESLAAAGEGDFVSAWLDQSGNRRHMMCGVDNFSLLTYADAKAPLVEGSATRWGTSASSTGQVLPLTGILDWWHGHTHGEVMIACRPTDDSPVSDGKNNLWNLGRTGGGSDGNATYPASDGHLYETAFTGSRRDLGVSAIDFSAMQVIGITAETLATSPNYIERIGNTIVLSATDVGASYPYFDGFIYLGFGQTSGYWDGVIKHLALFDAPLTTSQRASWFAFMNGSVTDPPLP